MIKMVAISKEADFEEGDKSVLEMLSLRCILNTYIEILSRWYCTSLEFEDL